MTTATNVLRKLQSRAPGMGLPRDFYTDDAIFRLDLDLIYYRESHPVLLVRAADGVIRAFINSCRHRGSRRCPESRGTASKLDCPYHQWTYELDGQLFAARQMGAGGDPSPFSDAQEGGVSQYVDWYCRRLAARLESEELTDVA
jgi:phenylpropionate dioxygenase-like ring-hydroxylating dioxygenase large terminal subunit